MSRTPAASSEDAAREAPGPVFTRILCAVDGSEAAQAGVEQAKAIAGPDGTIRRLFVATAAQRTPPDPDVETIADGLPREVLVREAARHDLVVAGGRSRSRPGGIFVGSVVTHLAHRSPVSVLVARPPAAGERFGRSIVAASDGSADADRAVDVAARLALRLDGRVTLVHVGGSATPEQSRRVAEQSAELYERMAVEPLLRTVPGPPVDGILKTVRHDAASLLVVGSRGLTGLKALGSVSERLVHRAPCSVLVVRAPATPAP